MNKLNKIFKLVLIFICMNMLGGYLIYSSFSDWRLQQNLIKEGVLTQAIVRECSFVRSGSCLVRYEFQVPDIDGDLKNYEIFEGTSCHHCEDKRTIIIRYLSQDPSKVMIEGEQSIMYIFGIFTMIVTWIIVVINVRGLSSNKNNK